MREDNYIDSTNRLATQLETMADWEDDRKGCSTKTTVVLRESAKRLHFLARYSCGAGYICSGGPLCDSDHK